MAKDEETGIDTRQEKICRAYVANEFNVSRTARALGMDLSHIARTLTRPHIQNRIRELKKPAKSTFEADRDEFVRQLRKERDWNVFDFFDFSDPKAPRFLGTELPHEFGRLINGLTTFTNPKTGEHVTKYHFVDRHKAEALLAKYFSVDEKSSDKAGKDSAKSAREAWKKQKKHRPPPNVVPIKPSKTGTDG